MSTLSNDLIKEILSRLPVKSLCRFKCVCKSWQFLISHPFFVKMHLSRGRTRLFSNYSFVLHCIDLERVSSEDKVISLITIDFPWNWREKGIVRCIGSCNGLLALRTEVGECFVYNPSTQAFKKILPFKKLEGKKTNFDEILLGFGYIESIDDYKLVKVLASTKDVEVYSLREHSWRPIENDYVLSAHGGTAGVFLNGAVHWAFKDRDGLCVIAAFDLAQEKFKTLPPPHHNLLTNKKDIYPFGILRGRLCMATMTGARFNQIWVMDEYGVKGSWTKFLIPRSFYDLRPVCYLNNTETVLLMTEEGLVFWDVKNGKLKNVNYREVYKWCDAYAYEESLVPIPPHNPDNIANGNH